MVSVSLLKFHVFLMMVTCFSEMHFANYPELYSK